MNTTQRDGIMQRWNIIQYELMPELRNEVGALTPKLVKLVHTLEWVHSDYRAASGSQNRLSGITAYSNGFIDAANWKNW